MASVTDKPNPTLSLDDTFASYQELQTAINDYENANRVQFWKRDVKKLQRASPRIFDIVKMYPQLEYCSVRFTCIHGGQTFRPKTILGCRKPRGTWKQNCKAEILVGLNADKNRLIVKKIVDEHNHEIPSEEVYKRFPKNRRHAERGKVVEIPVRKESVNMRLQEKKNILKNLVKANSFARSNNLRRISEVLTEKYHCSVDLQEDEREKIVGFFFQDPYMKKSFDMFPEILLVDGTYKLQNIECSVYILSTENSLGVSDIVGVGVLTIENKESIEWMLQTFKKRNPNWEKVAIVVTDRVTSQHKVLPTAFPGVKKLICHLHALQIFRRDTLPSLTQGITPSESETCFNFFKGLTEAKSEEDYHNILEDMEDNTAYTLMQYFFRSWHELRSEWVAGLTPIRACVNSCFDSLNSKLKSTIANCKTFSRFIENLFLVLYLKRNELKYDFGRMIKGISVYDDGIMRQYAKYLTTYALEKMKPHLLSREEMRFDNPNEDSDVICETKSSTFVVSEISCNCDFFTVMKLPCRHLLGYRRIQGMRLFDKYLFSERWTMGYMQEMLGDEVGKSEIPTGKSDERRFQQARTMCLQLVALCSEDEKFEERSEVLMKLREFWQNGMEVTVEEVGATASLVMEVEYDEDEVVKSDHDYVGSSGFFEVTNEK